MNICIVSNERLGPQKGGVESVCYYLVNALLERGHYVCHLFNHDKGTYKDDAIECLPLHFALEANCPENELRAFLCSRKIQIVWNHSPSHSLNRLLRSAAKNTNIKVVTIFHASPYADFSEFRERYALAWYRARYYHEWCEFFIYLLKTPFSFLNTLRKTHAKMKDIDKNSDCSCVLSERYIKSFRRLCIWANSSIYAVANPLPDIDQNLISVAKKKQVILVARHDWKTKRIDRAIKIWSKIESEYNEWKFVILGDGPHHDEFKKVAKRLGVDNVIFAGTQPPARYYAESKIILLTSGWEGLPMVLIEAQQYGCVPIAYESFAALSDIIENGVTGYRIRPFRERDFIAKLTRLMDCEDECDKMSRHCKQHSKTYSKDVILDCWFNIFKKIIAEEK